MIDFNKSKRSYKFLCNLFFSSSMDSSRSSQQCNPFAERKLILQLENEIQRSYNDLCFCCRIVQRLKQDLTLVQRKKDRMCARMCTEIHMWQGIITLQRYSIACNLSVIICWGRVLRRLKSSFLTKKID